MSVSGNSNFFADGQWNFFCELCGKKTKSSQGELTWDGRRVCAAHKEVRNQQDFIRGVREDLRVPWTAPEPPDQFVPIDYTRNFQEDFSIAESVAKTVTKRVNFQDSMGSGAIGEVALGKLALGSSFPYTLTVDDLVLAENITKSLNKPISEALSLSESISIILITKSVLGGSAIGIRALGV